MQRETYCGVFGTLQNNLILVIHSCLNGMIFTLARI